MHTNPGPDEETGPLVEEAVKSVITANGLGHGDYILVAQATVGDEGMTYTWQWFWRPADWTPAMSGGTSAP